MHFKMLTFLFYIFYLLHTKVISCPTGAFLSNSGDRCYFVPNDTEVFELGEKACQTYGGHLASIKNAFDNLLLTSNSLLIKTTFLCRSFPGENSNVFDSEENSSEIYLGRTLVNSHGEELKKIDSGENSMKLTRERSTGELFSRFYLTNKSDANYSSV